MFEHTDPNFFSPATRSRIIEFLLTRYCSCSGYKSLPFTALRKRFSEDATDDFAFGVERLIGDGAYTACYPLHDGQLRKIINLC